PTQRKLRRNLFASHTRTCKSKVRNVYTADQQYKRRASPQQIQCVLHVANQDILQPSNLCVESCIDEKRFEIWKSLEVGGVHRIHSSLRLLNGGARHQAGNIRRIVAMA